MVFNRCRALSIALWRGTNLESGHLDSPSGACRALPRRDAAIVPLKWFDYSRDYCLVSTDHTLAFEIVDDFDYKSTTLMRVTMQEQ